MPTQQYTSCHVHGTLFCVSGSSFHPCLVPKITSQTASVYGESSSKMNGQHEMPHDVKGAQPSTLTDAQHESFTLGTRQLLGALDTSGDAILPKHASVVRKAISRVIEHLLVCETDSDHMIATLYAFILSRSD